MRISAWSSVVCSSDLLGARHGNSATRPAGETGTGGLLESGRLGQTLAPLIVAAAASPQGTAYGRQRQEAFHAGPLHASRRLRPLARRLRGEHSGPRRCRNPRLPQGGADGGGGACRLRIRCLPLRGAPVATAFGLPLTQL